MSDIQTKSGAEIDADRKLGIIELGTQYAKYLGPNDIADAVRNGKSVEQFKDFIIEKIQSRHTDTTDIQVGLTRTEVKRYSLGRASTSG